MIFIRETPKNLSLQLNLAIKASEFLGAYRLYLFHVKKQA